MHAAIVESKRRCPNQHREMREDQDISGKSKNRSVIPYLLLGNKNHKSAAIVKYKMNLVYIIKFG